MPETILLVATLAVAGLLVLAPLRRSAGAVHDDAEREAAAVRHRVALESLRDVEADRRAGSLDDRGYAEQRAEAEARAARTAGELASAAPPTGVEPPRGYGRGAAGVAAVIGLALVAGSLVPAAGVANTQLLDCELALAAGTGPEREECLDGLLEELAANPHDPATVSSVADAYLAGSTPDDLVRAAAALQVLITLEPERADAYERIIGAYFRAGDAGNARAAWRSYADVDTADPVEVAFWDGMIALNAEGDEARAVEAFDRFLELAQDDPRADMVRALREDAAG
jgi:cytochrome c-type biogenesis protein CcmH/NrfG